MSTSIATTTTATTTTPVRTSGGVARRAAPAPVPDREEPRRRGRLVLAEKVVEKIAGQAGSEVNVASGRTGGVLGFGADADTNARPRVEVELSGTSADLAVKVGIAYPGSIRQATQRVREHITRRVEEMTGVDVRRVDIDVTFLTTDIDTRRKGELR